MDYFFRNYFSFTNYIPTDIYPVQYGEQQCTPDYYFGPSVRSNYILHYIYSGKGIFRVDNKEYHLHAGQLFLIKPNQLTYYKADSDEPWLYRWIEFNGSMAEKILSLFKNTDNIPFIDDDSEHSIGNTLADITQSGEMRYETLMQKFWSFIGSLTKNANSVPHTQSEEYVKKADLFIKNNIHKKITVNEIASHIGIDRSYLSRLFKDYKNISLQQYILTVKMNAAAQYLKNTDISISEVANSVGYYDYHVFNKVFHKHFNVSPSAWRKKQTWEQSLI